MAKKFTFKKSHLFRESYALNYLTKDHMYSSIFPKDPPYKIFLSDDKGSFHLRFSGIRPLRGSPPPLLTENQSEKKKVFFLSGKGGYPPPP